MKHGHHYIAAVLSQGHLVDGQNVNLQLIQLFDQGAKVLGLIYWYCLQILMLGSWQVKAVHQAYHSNHWTLGVKSARQSCMQGLRYWTASTVLMHGCNSQRPVLYAVRY